ncbi:MAG: arginine N-succinyltransferase [Oleiphilaceae bacterium]|nr:arginine N-succinyltransferase [Oleiphilaceae bacterium]
MFIRPLREKDLDDLHAMARSAGKGLTTLPADRALLADKIRRTREAFDQQSAPEAGLYLFALEDSRRGRCVGVSGIEARVGRDDVFWNYRLSTTVNASRKLGVHVRTPTLHLTNDMTDATEIGSLYLDERYRQDGNGLLLSLSRFLYLQEFPGHFSDKVFAEMRGVSDKAGYSPFWEALGRRFFDMEFSEADYLSGLGRKSFIAELMPKFPIYLFMLSEAAQAAVAQVHDNTAPALRMLEAEGFNFNGLVDIFDGGPLVEAFIHNIRTARDSLTRPVSISAEAMDSTVPPAKRLMVANGAFRDFRVTTLPAHCVGPESVTVPVELAEILLVKSGDRVRLAPLKRGG